MKIGKKIAFFVGRTLISKNTSTWHDNKSSPTSLTFRFIPFFFDGRSTMDGVETFQFSPPTLCKLTRLFISAAQDL
jgi:hypothetical protein